jgi:hypothetical protein
MVIPIARKKHVSKISPRVLRVQKNLGGRIKKLSRTVPHSVAKRPGPVPHSNATPNITRSINAPGKANVGNRCRSSIVRMIAPTGVRVAAR